MPEQRPSVGTPVRVTRSVGDPWPGTVVPSARGLSPTQINVMEHDTGRVVTVRLEQLALPDADEAVLTQAREVLARHGHGLSATCTPACHQRTPAPFPPPCPRCSGTRWVSVSLDGGTSQRARCAPCGYVHPMPLPGTVDR